MQADWLAPRTIPILSPNSAHVWRFSLETPTLPLLLEASHSILSDAELARAAKIRIPAVRNEVVAARTLLRTLLATATGRPARLLALTYGAAGKPLLSPPPELAFNVSHSAGLVLIALTRRGTIGVDLESLTQNRILPEEMLQIAQDTFTPSIAAELASLPDGPEWVQAFYRAWTIREAVAKSDGRGIASPLKYYQFQTDQPNEVRVVLEPETPLGPASLAAEYLVHTFQLGIQASMAVALSQPEQKIELFDAANLLG